MSANAYARIAERYLVTASDDEAVERFFLDVAPTLSHEEREAIVAELLADEASGTSVPDTTEIRLGVPTYSIDEAPPVVQPSSLAQLVGELSAAVEKRVGDRVDAVITRAMDRFQERTTVSRRGRRDNWRGASLAPIRDEFQSNEFWEQNYKRFIIFAHRVLAGRRIVPAGVPEAHDYVLMAAELLLNGQRRCPSDLDPVDCTFGVIRSLISNDYRRYENQFERHPITTLPDEEGSIGIDESLVPDLVVSEIESMVAARDLADHFLQSMPKEYRRYVELRIAQPGNSTYEYATALNLDIASIRNMTKKIRRWRSRWDERSTRALTELPLLPDTVLGSVIGQDAATSEGVKKLREEIRKELRSTHGHSVVSLGSHGSMNLDPAPLFTCLYAGAVWDRKRALFLADAYRDAGLGKLLASKRFQRAQSAAAARLQEGLSITAESNAMAAAVTTLFDVTTTDHHLHDVAEEMKHITDTVDQKVQELRRTRGTIVRFENGEAVVVLEKEGLSELPAALLRASGLFANGTPFILHELTFSPDRHARIALPAIDLR